MMSDHYEARSLSVGCVKLRWGGNWSTTKVRMLIFTSAASSAPHFIFTRGSKKLWGRICHHSYLFGPVSASKDLILDVPNRFIQWQQSESVMHRYIKFAIKQREVVTPHQNCSFSTTIWLAVVSCTLWSLNNELQLPPLLCTKTNSFIHHTSNAHLVILFSHHVEQRVTDVVLTVDIIHHAVILPLRASLAAFPQVH